MRPREPEFLFLYGTLLPGRTPPAMAPLVAQLHAFAWGHLEGTLYDFGEYPGAVIGGNHARRIRGLVVRLPEEPTVLDALDRYEEFDAAAPRNSLFVRQVQPVQLATGAFVECWVYLYNREVGAAREIAGTEAAIAGPAR